MLRKLRTGLTIVPLLWRLPSVKSISDSESAVDFAMKSRFIRPEQVRWEFRQLAAVVQELKPKAAMEIGTMRGGSLFALCRLSDARATVISLDLPGGRFGGGYHWFQAPIFRAFAGSNQSLYLIRGDSHDQGSKDKVQAALLGNQLDFLMIDGDHTYTGVRQDFEMYSPFVRRGGMVAFHDIVNHPSNTKCEVARFWNEIKHSFQNQEIIFDRGQGWAGIGILTVH
jgi:predicted O-methyltransferase YrrM